MKKAGDSALMALDDEADLRPVAVIADTDIPVAVADGKDPRKVRISDLPGREPITVPPEQTAASAANLMVSSRIRHLPVVESGRLGGMVEIVDACRGLIRD